jgi:hypothetical protein
MSNELAWGAIAVVLLVICLWQQWQMADLRDELECRQLEVEQLLSEASRLAVKRLSRTGGIINKARKQ